MILAFDTFYTNDMAITVAVEFNSWSDSEPIAEHYSINTTINDYVSGEFYKRELPCILKTLETISLKDCQAIIIDGYVVLDDYGKLGLGGYLFNALNKKIPIIGVAKTDFHQINKLKELVYRGESKKPLFITSLGIETKLAANYIKIMNGEYRLPQLLKRVDSLGREKVKEDIE